MNTILTEEGGAMSADQLRRILVLGSGGAGKSTLSAALGERLGLPVIHLDAHYWRSGWIETPKEEWPEIVKGLLEQDRWVMDGNYTGSLEQRLSRCDVAIFLDRSRFTCLWRVIKRRLVFHGRTRPDMPSGCPEKVDWEFLCWIWNYPATVRPKILPMLKNHASAKQVVILRSDREVSEFLARLSAVTR